MSSPRRHPLAVLAAVLLAATVVGCSSSGQTTAASPAASPAASGSASSAGSAPASASATSATSATSASASASASATQIVISGFAFHPTDLTVSPGQTVTVLNHDSTAHTLTATSGHAFDTGHINGGASATFTAPSKPGDYPYTCLIHPSMHGTLTVR